MVAGRDARHIGADHFYNAGALMSEDRRERRRIALIANHDIGVAHTRGDDPNKNLVMSGLADTDILDLKRLAALADDSRFHFALRFFRHALSYMTNGQGSAGVGTMSFLVT
jgi:hypothetical protein